ncbi:LuxR C-terminal-related transcriptional regulator [Prevotella merdae]|uniref:LuxR C-terminal-related transcriptional regulator n=1 Tax=Prevotella merdae TaxID=2079531 RepID=UPI003568EC1C
MKSKLIQRLTIFLDRRSHNWQQRMCLITFLMLSLSVVLGVPMHFIGMIGRCDTILYTISAMSWAATLTILIMYLTQRMRLTVAISSFGILTQLAESARIVYVAMERPDGFEETIVFNLVISLALIIYMVMAAVRHMPTILAIMSIATITSAYLYTDGEINRQIVVIFVIVEIFTCILGEMIRRGIRSMQRENADYHSTLNRVLSTFHMTKTELLAYIQLGRGEQSDKDITDFFNRLDERTEANLIRAVEQRVAQRKMQHADISAVLPTLTPTEQEVCRLIIGGKTIIEIASILHKNANNVSSVRIHIRKKLGLATGKDLREALLEVMQK